MKKNSPTRFNGTKQILTVHTLTKTIQSKVFNHKQFVRTLDTKNILENMKNLPCNYTASAFTDPNHRNIITGDIRIIQNN